MAEFLQSYGIWIFFGLLFLLMLRDRSHGMGCCGSEHRQDPETVRGEEQQEPEKRSSSCH